MSRKVLFVAAAVVVAGIVGVVGYQRISGDAAADTDAPETAVVRRDTLQATVGGTGSLVPESEVALSFSSGGTVAEVFVAEGDAVTEGQPLAVLDTRELQLALQSAEASLTSAQSGLASAQTSLSQVLSGADERELAMAKVNVDQAKDKLWGTQAQRDGTCGQVESGRRQDYECDQAEASVLQAEGAVRQAELQYEDLLAGAGDTELASAHDKVSQAQAQVASAETGVEQARLRLEQATLTAPMDGTITSLDVTAGEAAGASGPAIVVSGLGALEVVIQLDETDVAEVSVGQAALVTLEAFSDEDLGGVVSAIAPVAQTQSGVVLFPVTITVDDTDLPLRPGMTADVEIVTMSVEDALVVPLRAVISGPRGDMVMRVNPDVEGVADAAKEQPGFAGAPPEGMTRGDRQGTGGGTFAGTRQMMGGAGTEPVPVTIVAKTTTDVAVTGDLAEGDVIIVPDTSASDQDGVPRSMPMGGMFRGPR